MLAPAFTTPLPLPILRSSTSRTQTHASVHMARRPGRHSSGASNRDMKGPARARPPQKRQRNGPAFQSQSEYHRAMELSTHADKRPARAAFRAAARANPEDGRLWLGWAQMEARAGRIDLARDVFRRGVEQNGTNVRLLHAWAVEEDRAGDGQTAQELFDRCLQLDRTDGIVWQSYALSQERHAGIEEARHLFRQGSEADPKNAHLWSAWGVMEHRHGHFEVASQLFEQAVRFKPRHIRTLQAWAITNEKLGKFDESDRLFRAALNIRPSAPTFQAYGLFEARRGRLEQARELFKSGIEIDEDHAPIWHAWAVMEQRDGNYERARELFDRGVAAAPNSTPMLRAWASMELELGHIDKSRDWTVPPGARKKAVRESKHKKDGASTRKNAKQISAVGENLRMLRLLIERRSDEDIKTVMKWLDRRAKQDRRLYDAIAERKESDSRIVKEWIQRRSESDVAAFKDWVADRYKKDARIGVYLFNWDIPRPMAPQPLPVPVKDHREKEKPIEWFKLSEKPAMTLQTFDEQIYSREAPTDYADGVYFVGQIAEGLVDRAALIFILSTLTFCLIGASSQLFSMGYSPSGDNAQLPSNPSDDTAPPTGVDAHLYEEGGAESVADFARWTKGRK